MLEAGAGQEGVPACTVIVDKFPFGMASEPQCASWRLRDKCKDYIASLHMLNDGDHTQSLSLGQIQSSKP